MSTCQVGSQAPVTAASIWPSAQVLDVHAFIAEYGPGDRIHCRLEQCHCDAKPMRWKGVDDVHDRRWVQAKQDPYATTPRPRNALDAEGDAGSAARVQMR